jgi:hypothetical protein
MSIAVQTLADAGRNYTVRVVGIVNGDLVPRQIITHNGRLRVARVVWLIQEKMGLTLWWGEERCADNLMMVMESRNAVAYSPPLQPPESWAGQIWLRSFGYDRVPDLPAHFTFTLDFDR